MYRVLMTSVVLAGLLASVPALSQARTCTARDQLCRNECINNFRNSSGCNRTCDQRLAGCKSNGCWGSGADSRCDFQKS